MAATWQHDVHAESHCPPASPKFPHSPGRRNIKDKALRFWHERWSNLDGEDHDHTPVLAFSFPQLISRVTNKLYKPAGRKLPVVVLQSDGTFDSVQLSFFDKHMTKPIDADPENPNRKFDIRSRGSVVTALAMLLFLVAAVAGAIVITTDRDEQRQPSKESTPIRAAIQENFPDPALWLVNGTWYAYATNSAAGILAQSPSQTIDHSVANVQLATSKDFINWDVQRMGGDTLPLTGQWTVQGSTTSQPPLISRADVWAPSVNQRATDNRYVLYYAAARSGGEGSIPGRGTAHCIGAAVSQSSSAAGPFIPLNETLACQVAEGGAIDPYGFTDADGTMYVAYKIDGNNVGHGGSCGNTVEPLVSTPIMLQKMKPDGVTGDGDPIQILDRDSADGPLIEAPSLVRSREGVYFLFFSSGCTAVPTYNVKYATASSVGGMYTRASSPLLTTGDYGLVAPGSIGIHEDGGDGWNMAFHARLDMRQGGIRAMFTAKLQLTGRHASMVHGQLDGLVERR